MVKRITGKTTANKAITTANRAVATVGKATTANQATGEITTRRATEKVTANRAI